MDGSLFFVDTRFGSTKPTSENRALAKRPISLNEDYL